jgi:tRNA (cmo5U34)-methyltransferase
MGTPLEQKSSLEEIEKRFDNDVDRFSNLETGQSATVDAPLAMELITERKYLNTSIRKTHRSRSPTKWICSGK